MPCFGLTSIMLLLQTWVNANWAALSDWLKFELAPQGGTKYSVADHLTAGTQAVHAWLWRPHRFIVHGDASKYTVL